jgi:hypothetical protein
MKKVLKVLIVQSHKASKSMTWTESDSGTGFQNSAKTAYKMIL